MVLAPTRCLTGGFKLAILGNGPHVTRKRADDGSLRQKEADLGMADGALVAVDMFSGNLPFVLGEFPRKGIGKEELFPKAPIQRTTMMTSYGEF